MCTCLISINRQDISLTVVFNILMSNCDLLGHQSQYFQSRLQISSISKCTAKTPQLLGANLCPMAIDPLRNPNFVNVVLLESRPEKEGGSLL